MRSSRRLSIDGQTHIGQRERCTYQDQRSNLLVSLPIRLLPSRIMIDNINLPIYIFLNSILLPSMSPHCSCSIVEYLHTRLQYPRHHRQLIPPRISTGYSDTSGKFPKVYKYPTRKQRAKPTELKLPESAVKACNPTPPRTTLASKASLRRYSSSSVHKI